ncbi:hypothetical protein ACFW90_08965, partial [Streptomyces amritsarensis]
MGRQIRVPGVLVAALLLAAAAGCSDPAGPGSAGGGDAKPQPSASPAAPPARAPARGGGVAGHVSTPRAPTPQGAREVGP